MRQNPIQLVAGRLVHRRKFGGNRLLKLSDSGVSRFDGNASPIDFSMLKAFTRRLDSLMHGCRIKSVTVPQNLLVAQQQQRFGAVAETPLRKSFLKLPAELLDFFGKGGWQIIEATRPIRCFVSSRNFNACRALVPRLPARFTIIFNRRTFRNWKRFAAPASCSTFQQISVLAGSTEKSLLHRSRAV
jgi:hypothetical protein